MNNEKQILFVRIVVCAQWSNRSANPPFGSVHPAPRRQCLTRTPNPTSRPGPRLMAGIEIIFRVVPP